MGLVGESGCGKSTLGAALLSLVAAPGRIVNGRIRFEGHDLVGMPEADIRRLRGQRISMIAQDALAVLNPVVRVGPQVGDVVSDHVEVDAAEVRTLVLDTLRRVRLDRKSVV